jgi:hypothetical protein
MKHAIALLTLAKDTAQATARQRTAEGDSKGRNKCVAEAWDYMDAMEVLKLEMAKRKTDRKASLKTEH